MPDTARLIPQPVPVDAVPPPFVEAPPLPDCLNVLRITQVAATGALELAVVFKRTYTFEAGRGVHLADQQIPLDEDGETYDPLSPDVPASFKSLPEIVGFKTGTDVVVQGSARPRRPSASLKAAVQVGTHRHEIYVIGKRICEHVNGKLVFSPPEPFEQMPIRYENAYGGRDLAYERALMQEVERITPPEQFRKGRSYGREFFSANHPFLYPRNRFGKGYILDDRPESIEGRELPNLESPSHRLTPQTLVLADPLEWLRQPVPVGFDYLDVLSFPRSAMLGIPPLCRGSLDNAPEVASGLIPNGFSRGNLFAGSTADILTSLHPDASRCASLGLRMNFLTGREPIVLFGLDPDDPELQLNLPDERPVICLGASPAAGNTIEPQLHLVTVDMNKRLLKLIWSGRIGAQRPLLPGEDSRIAASCKVEMRTA